MLAFPCVKKFTRFQFGIKAKTLSSKYVCLEAGQFRYLQTDKVKKYLSIHKGVLPGTMPPESHMVLFWVWVFLSGAFSAAGGAGNGTPEAGPRWWRAEVN